MKYILAFVAGVPRILILLWMIVGRVTDKPGSR